MYSGSATYVLQMDASNCFVYLSTLELLNACLQAAPKSLIRERIR